MNRYSENEYYFAAAKIASMSRRLMTAGDLFSLAESGSTAAAFDRLTEFGITTVSDGNRPDAEATLVSFASGAYRELSSFLPDRQLLSVITAKHDVHNIKTAVKCLYTGADPSLYLTDCGLVPAEAAISAAESRDFSAYPALIASAASSAVSELYASGLIRRFETFMDAACFEYMTKEAEALGSDAVSYLLALRIDLINLVTAKRISRLSNPPEGILDESLIAGGRIKKTFFENAGNSLPFGEFGDIYGREPAASASTASDISAPELAKAADRIFLGSTLSLCGREQLGILPVICYLVRLEYQIKNLRIILFGLSEGRPSEKIREELRL